MRQPLPRALYVVLSLFLCFFVVTSAFGQTPDPQAPAPDPAASPAPDPGAATDDPSQAAPADPNAAATASPTDQDRIDLVSDTDSADLPSFFKGLIDTEDYLRMRNAHNRRLRGLMDPSFQPWRRNGAIYTTQQRERQLQDAVATGSGDPAFIGPQAPNSFAPIIASARCGLNHSLNISVLQYSSREANISGFTTAAKG